MNNIELSPGQAESRQNRRVFMRSLYPKDCEIHFRGHEWPRAQLGILHSISKSGLFVKFNRPPEIGAKMQLAFVFGGQRVTCHGEVLYRCTDNDPLETQGFGIKFTRMLNEDYQVINQSINQFYDLMKF